MELYFLNSISRVLLLRLACGETGIASQPMRSLRLALIDSSMPRESLERSGRAVIISDTHPLTFCCRSLVGPGCSTLVPGLGSLVRHSECSVEQLNTKGTCLPPPPHPHAALVARLSTHADCSRESRYLERDETFTCRGLDHQDGGRGRR